PQFEAATLTAVARASLGSATATVSRWDLTPIEYPAVSALTAGLYRVGGMAIERGAELPWSAVLKAIRCPRESARDPRNLSYWKREALVYRSELFGDLTAGLRLPRCYGVQELENETALLWLEDAADEHDGRWSLALYVDVARQLGEWQGSYSAGRGLPSEPWLTRGLIAAICEERAAAYVRTVSERRPWAEPRWQRAFPRTVAGRLQRLLAARKSLLAGLERAEQSLCHFDLSRHNLMRRAAAGGREETVVIDWAYAGIGALGVDLSLLVPSPFFRMEADVAGLPDHAKAVFSAYIDGLRNAGFRGDERTVRFAYAASTALRTVFFAPTVTAVDPAARAAEEQRWGLPTEEILDRRAALTVFLLDLADEALELLEAV
ncbi:MAG: aminoglycoside phosphotransferase family protein, partial [Actinomycetota bacterium]|nr:aminoglycoside phosphotransferase family protein [Actinomycetota bacterium]